MQELEPGLIIQSRYRLDTQIGEGGFGTVWRATQLGVERVVALKFLRTDLAPDARLRFEREAKALGMLNHPGCVTLYDFGITAAGQPFLATEFVHGESLSAWRRREHSLNEVLDVGRQLAAALAHAHRHHLIHRDLKPSNVMITRDDDGAMRVKVLDFGVARVAGDVWPDITKTGVVIGTPGFMSPEQLIGGELSAKTDLYALGVLLFELVEGRPPFEAETTLKLAMRHLKEDAPPMTSGPVALRTLVDQLLSRHPDDRPATARHVADILRGIDANAEAKPVASLREEAVTVLQRAATTPFESRQLVRRKPSAGTVALIGLAIVALIGFVITLVQMTDTTDNTEPKSDLSRVLKPVKSSNEADVGAEKAPEVPDVPDVPDVSDVGQERGTAGCGKRVSGRGLIELTEIDGLSRRTVDVFVPTSYDPDEPRPAVVLLHDTLESSVQIVSGKGFGRRANASNVILILPRDPSLKSPWRGGNAVERAVADIETVKNRLCVDPDQLFVFGNAVAGSGVDEMLCQADFAGAAVSGHRLKRKERMCKGGAAVPYLIFHQMKGFEPPEGGKDCLNEERASIDEHNALLIERNRCKDRRKVSTYKGSECFTWTCEQDLVSCRVDGGRPWRGEGRLPCEGKAADFPYLDTVWDFFFDRASMFDSTK